MTKSGRRRSLLACLLACLSSCLPACLPTCLPCPWSARSLAGSLDAVLLRRGRVATPDRIARDEGARASSWIAANRTSVTNARYVRAAVASDVTSPRGHRFIHECSMTPARGADPDVAPTRGARLRKERPIGSYILSRECRDGRFGRVGERSINKRSTVNLEISVAFLHLYGRELLYTYVYEREI